MNKHCLDSHASVGKGAAKLRREQSLGERLVQEEVALWEQKDQDSRSPVYKEGLPAAVLCWCSPRGDWQFMS